MYLDVSLHIIYINSKADRPFFRKGFMKTEFPKSSHQSGLRFMKRNPHPSKDVIRDCGVRAICLAFDLEYEKVFKACTQMKRMNAPTYEYWSIQAQDVVYKRSNADASKGLNRRSLMDALEILGLDVVYQKTTDKKRNIHMYFNADNLPDRCIAHVPNHWVAVRDGAIWDTWDSRGKRARKLRGYVCLRGDN